jgi:hypothetical protein
LLGQLRRGRVDVAGWAAPDEPYVGKVASPRYLTGEITLLSEVIVDLLAGDRGYQVIQQLPCAGRSHHRRDRGRARVQEREPLYS